MPRRVQERPLSVSAGEQVEPGAQAVLLQVQVRLQKAWAGEQVLQAVPPHHHHHHHPSAWAEVAVGHPQRAWEEEEAV